MAWRDNLLDASFRGVPFKFEDAELEGGRRLAEHEFPLRDDAFVEDMGKGNRRYQLTGYVIGPDYMAARNALLDALEAGGEGQLQHPYLGPLTVHVLRPFRLRESRDEGGMARFDISFIDAGSNPSPLSGNDTAGEALSAGENGYEQFGQSFEEGWEAGADGEFAMALLEQLLEALQLLLDWPGIDTLELAELLAGLVENVADAAAIASAVTLFLSGYSDAVVISYAPFDENQSSRGALPVGDPSYGLAILSAWGTALDKPVGWKRRQKQGALVALVQGSAAAALVQVYARTSFAGQADAQTARDQLTGICERLIVDASDAGDDAAGETLATLSAAASADLTARGKQLPVTRKVAIGAVLPAIVLSQRFYGDARRAGELVARNAAAHPLFMPTQLEVLAS